jgi:perosamine synthetase
LTSAGRVQHLSQALDRVVEPRLRRLATASTGLSNDVRRGQPSALNPRHRLDIRTRDLVYAIVACAFTSSRERREHELATAWSPEAIVCRSLRSAFDLLLNALELPVGSEVLMSAITHPDMVRIAGAHRLGVLPVDLDTETLAPRLDALEQAVTPQTRVLIVAHLFGARLDLEPIAQFAHAHGLLLVEDCAQGFIDPGESGDPRADVSLYSFGSIKTATALGGALARVRDTQTREKMWRLQGAYPVQPRRAFARKAVATLALTALGCPALYGLAFRFWRRRGMSFDELLEHVVRGFSALPDEQFYARIRERPSAPLLALLARRLRRYDNSRLRERTRLGERLAASLAPQLVHPGRHAPVRTHWLFPVLTPQPPALIASLRAAGFDATAATSSISTVPAPPGRADLEPATAAGVMREVVFLPAYPELQEGDRGRLCALLTNFASAGPICAEADAA